MRALLAGGLTLNAVPAEAAPRMLEHIRGVASHAGDAGRSGAPHGIDADIQWVMRSS